MLLRSKLFLSLLNRSCVQNSKYSIKIGENPLGSIFFHPRIQILMKKLTIVDYEKIFEIRKMGQSLRPARYTFMTDEELEKERKKIRAKADALLKMPPLVDVTEEKIEVLSNDSSLDGHDIHHSKMIFTDISLDIAFHERQVVVREPDGLLRTASKSEKRRMNQIYFPIPERHLHVPKMFEPEHLKEVLSRGDYEFILNRACIQFNPEDEEYHTVISATFDYVNDKGGFDKLIKTRHFGPFALYLAINNKINNMLGYFLEREKLMEASFLIDIHRIVHTESPWSFDEEDEGDKKFEELLSFDQMCKTVENFISDPKNQASRLKSCFDALVQKLKDQEELKKESLKTHGL